MIDILIIFVNVVFQLLFWLVLIAVILSYFMDPYHPVRRRLDSIVEPMLAPIRRIMPPMGGLDFSPIILIILIQIVANIIKSLLFTLR